MIQTILLVAVFLGALFYLGSYFYRQIKSGKGEGQCDKCLPKNSAKEH